MWDLAQDKNSVKLIESFRAAGKPNALVCHAPGALRHVKTPDSKPLVQGKKVTGFTDGEENEMGLTKVVPLLVEDELINLGATFSEVKNWGVSHGDRRPVDHRPKSGLLQAHRKSPNREAQ
jgi:putative intracellular protease/amidase